MKRQVKKTVQKGLCMLLAGVAVLTASLSLTACVDQHPDSTEGHHRQTVCVLWQRHRQLHRFVTNWN